MTFCTAINCIDGRVQIPVIQYLKHRFSAEFVDMITEPGPVGAFGKKGKADTVAAIRYRVQVSIEAHNSKNLAIAAHADCAGNPKSDREQQKEIAVAVNELRKTFPAMKVLGLWVDKTGRVTEVSVAT